MTVDLLESFRQAVVDRWKASLAAGQLEGDPAAATLGSLGANGAGAQTGRASDSAARREVPLEVRANTLLVNPELLMLSEAVMLGWPIRDRDFFVVEPDRPYLVAAPDPELEPNMRVQVHIPVIRSETSSPARIEGRSHPG
ncbi:MAG TPA: hypothetical protein VFV02_16930, partial [Acidimicrobiales bacterium]|nr:hypothetical protein [Acidimicrobiales bacterium]